MGNEKHWPGYYLIDRKRRRTLGVILLVLITVMMMIGVHLLDSSNHPMGLLVYWGCVLLLLLFVIYLALLDALFIRYQYVAKSRDIFRATFGVSVRREVTGSTKEDAHDRGKE